MTRAGDDVRLCTPRLILHHDVVLVVLSLVLVLFVEESSAFVQHSLLLRDQLTTNNAHFSHRGSCLVAKARSESLAAQEYMTDDLADEIAREVASSKQLRMPFVPSPVVKYALKQATRHFSSDLSVTTMDRLRQVLRAAKTKSWYDDVDKQELNALADQIAVEISPRVDMPMLDEEQELLVLQQVMRVFLLTIATNKKDKQKFMLDTTLTLMRSSEEDQDRLVKSISAQIDIPLVDEKQKEAFITKAVEASARLVKDVLPDEMGDVLRQESPDGIDKVKQYVTAAVNDKVILVGLSGEQQSLVVEKMVDMFVDQYVDGTEAEYVLIGNDIDKQEAFLMEKRNRLVREQYLSQLRYEREKINLALHLEKIDQRLKSVRRSRSLLRRFVRVFRRQTKE